MFKNKLDPFDYVRFFTSGQQHAPDLKKIRVFHVARSADYWIFSSGKHFCGRLRLSFCLCGCHSFLTMFLSRTNRLLKCLKHVLFPVKGQGHRDRSKFSLVFVVSTPWLRAYLTDITCEVTMCCTSFPGQKVKSSGSQKLFEIKVMHLVCSKFLLCMLRSCMPIWLICFIWGINTTHEMAMCCAPFSFRSKGQRSRSWGMFQSFSLSIMSPSLFDQVVSYVAPFQYNP